MRKKMRNYLDLEPSKSFPYMRDVCINTIYEYAKKNKNIYFTTPDMGAPALDEFRSNIPKQYIHSGICEQHMIAMAAGLTLMNKIVFCYAMAPFITSRCYEQIKCSISAMNQPVTLIGIGVGLGYADAGPTHYTTEDIATMRVFPNIEILTPCDEISTREMTIECIKNPKFRFLRLDRDALPEIYNGKNKFNLAKGWTKIYGDTKKTCLITCGYLLHKCLKVAKSKKIKDLEIIDLFRLKDVPQTLIDYIKNFESLVTIEEQYLNGGLGSILLEKLSEKKIDIKIRRFGLDDRFYFENGGRDLLHTKYGLNIEKIITEIG